MNLSTDFPWTLKTILRYSIKREIGSCKLMEIHDASVGHVWIDPCDVLTR